MPKKLIPKIVVAVLLTLVISVTAFYALEWVLGRVLLAGMCGNTVFSELKSPDGKLKAVVFGRSCGATDGVSTQISILPINGDLSNEVGNICGVSIFPNVELRWAGNDELIIMHREGTKFFNAVQSLNGVKIRYEVEGQTASNNSLNRSAS